MVACLGSRRRAARRAAAEAAQQADGEPVCDDLAGRKAQVASWDALLAAVETFTEDIAAAAGQFAAAPGALLKHLEQTCNIEERDKCPGDAPALWSQLVPQLASQLGHCAEGLQKGQRRVQAMRYLLEQSRAQSAEVHEAFGMRDAAWGPKAQCDERAAELRKRFGPSLLLRERKARLQAKHTADLNYQQRTDEAEKAAGDMLDRRWAITGAMLWEICQYYTDVFREADKLLRGFSDIANHLAPPPATEALLVPADSVIAQSSAGLPGVREWVEKAKSAAASGAGSGGKDIVNTLQLPPRRRPPAMEPIAPSLPPLQRPGGPSFAATAPGRLEGLRPELASPSLSLPRDTRAAPLTYSRGEELQVWSCSAESWFDAVVDEVFTKPVIAHGFWVPAGAVKVTHAGGIKYIRPEQLSTQLRRRPLADDLPENL